MKAQRRTKRAEDRRTKSTIIPVKMGQELAQQIRSLADEFGEPDSTIMRLAINAGLPRVKEALGTLRSTTTTPPAQLHYTHK